ncbi:MAG: GDP-mannose 4,6-dehydratase [Endomicrobiia bacterium]|nr:GDP-mannose 4,6-dehydratase [Endomicrobiia bacterium]
MRKIKKILVTGASGYMGGHFINAAKDFFKGSAITAADLILPLPRAAAIMPTKKIRFVKCDISDSKAVDALVSRARPDVIINLAGTGSATLLPWDVLVKANLMTAVSVMEAAASLKGKSPRVILIGSAAEYGALKSSQLPATEKLPLKPVSPYGIVKSWQSAAAKYFAARGLEVIITRMFNVLGPKMSEHLSVGSFAAQVSRIESGECEERVLRVGDIAAKRDFVDVRDVADALCRIVLKGKSGGIYNVASGKSVSLERIIKILCASSRVKIKIAREPSRLRANDVKDIRGSSVALRKQTGWKPRYTLTETLNSIRE